LTNGTNHLVEVISADELEIKYKKFDDLDGPELTMTVFKLRRILYDDGTMINYGNPLVRNGGRTTVDYGPDPSFRGNLKEGSNNYVQGRMDAQSHYRKYKGAGTLVLLTSLASPLVGLIPAAATAATPPKDYNLGIPGSAQWDDYEYRLGYNDRAKEIKKSAVWNNWLVGFGVNVLFVLILLNG